MSQIHGTVWWSELMTRDTAAAMSYYTSVCGWTFETTQMESGPYHVGYVHGRPVAGIMDMSGLPGMDGTPPHWFTYFAVDDLDAALERATAQGGGVTRPPYDVPEVGRIALATDGSGAALGLMVPVTEWDLPDAGNGALDNVPV